MTAALIILFVVTYAAIAFEGQMVDEVVAVRARAVVAADEAR